MKIVNVLIKNYRNLDRLEISLQDDCNFLVGENNVGKSNFLRLLSTVFNSRAFRKDDFLNPKLPIRVQIALRLSEVEIGTFEDLFEMDDPSLINVVAEQTEPEENIEYFHLETGTYIPHTAMRNANFIHYDSLRDPIAEINFDRSKGAGKFLRNIIARYVETAGASNNDYMDPAKVLDVVRSVNTTISKIKAFTDFGITANVDDDLEELLSKILVLKDGKGAALSKAGYGVQFLLLVTLSILHKLQLIKEQRGEKGVYLNESTNSRSISMIIGLDEPEIHLHPYMQRSLIRYLNSVVGNSNPDFKLLIKELFDIDEFHGQIIIATHSPNVLLNDYKQIVRFYCKDDKTDAVSGSKVELSAQLRKHLHMQLTHLKEAFFARCVIFVEGDTEVECMKGFAETLGVHFDDLGVCVIQARSREAVPLLIELASKFKIDSVGITDRDDGSDSPQVHNHFQTDLRDFEAEICSLLDSGKEVILRSILTQIDADGLTKPIQKGSLNKYAYSKHSLSATEFTASLSHCDILPSDLNSFRAFYVTWFSKNKTISLGNLIGNTLEANDIPPCFSSLIFEAKQIAMSL